MCGVCLCVCVCVVCMCVVRMCVCCAYVCVVYVCVCAHPSSLLGAAQDDAVECTPIAYRLVVLMLLDLTQLEGMSASVYGVCAYRRVPHSRFRCSLCVG